MKRSLLILLLTPIIILSFVTVSHAQYTITQLTNNAYHDFEPQINANGWVVLGSGEGIWLYDGATTTKIADDSYTSPQINNNGWVVWGSQEGLWLYDGTTTTKIADDSYTFPRINDSGWVVWSAFDNTDEEIFLYDGTITTKITNNFSDDILPQINDSGYVVWTHEVCLFSFNGCRGYSEILLYDGTSTTQLAIYGVYHHSPPMMNNNGWVVWRGITPSPCFIATAAFGTEFDAKIRVLRSFRDRHLQNDPVGRAFLSAYYECSPRIADFVSDREWLRTLVRILLLPVIGIVSLFV